MFLRVTSGVPSPDQRYADDGFDDEEDRVVATLGLKPSIGHGIGSQAQISVPMVAMHGANERAGGSSA